MSKSMKTLVVDKDGKLSVEECPMPEYNECQALVKTISCGVCNGTDGKLISRTFKGFDLDMYPVMLGHEAVGRVIEIGSKVTSFKVGDIVLIPKPNSLFTQKRLISKLAQHNISIAQKVWNTSEKSFDFLKHSLL